MPEAFAVRVFDLKAEVDGHVRIDPLGQKVFLRQGEQRDIELHIKDLDLKVHFWLEAQAAIAACHAEEIRETLQWYASEEAYRTEGKPGDMVYDRMHRRERVLLDRGERARALLAKLEGQS